MKRMLPLLLLLAILLSSTLLARAAEPPPPVPATPPPRESVEPEQLQQRIGDAPWVELSLLVRADGSWSGQVRTLRPAPGGSRDGDPTSGRTVSETFLVSGEQLQQLGTVAFGGEDLTAAFAGPVLLELRGPVQAGQTLELVLPANPSTGYGWAVAALGGDVLAQTGDVETRQVWPGLGTWGQQVVRLQATGTATAAQLQLAYHRPWEPDTPPVRTISLQAEGIDLASVCAALEVSVPQPAAIPTPTDEEGATTAEPPTLAEDDPRVLPSAFNWCSVHGCSPVRNQGACGSCWAFGTVGPLEQNVGPATNLSEQFLLSCNTYSYDCSGGWWAHDFHVSPGAVLEADFPYVATDTVPCGGPYNHPYSISSWDYVGNWYSVPSTAAIQQAIYDHGPVAVSMCVGPAFQAYPGGVFSTNETCTGDVNHGVVLVGWDDAQGVWFLRNSWGSGWGESGYMRIAYGTSNVGYGASYVEYDGTNYRVFLPLQLRNFSVGALRNGNFEAGRDGSWTESSSNGWDLIYQESELLVAPHGGDWAAWLGGDDDETSVLSQATNIPANATTLNYWYWSASEDACGFDYGRVRFGSTTLQNYNLCSSTNTGQWVQQQIGLTAWRGQTVDLRFVVETDGSLNSNLFLDDVSISTSTTAPVTGAARLP
jgi:C1A family cysteine protease